MSMTLPSVGLLPQVRLGLLLLTHVYTMSGWSPPMGTLVPRTSPRVLHSVHPSRLFPEPPSPRGLPDSDRLTSRGTSRHLQWSHSPRTGKRCYLYEICCNLPQTNCVFEVELTFLQYLSSYPPYFWTYLSSVPHYEGTVELLCSFTFGEGVWVRGLRSVYTPPYSHTHHSSHIWT